MSPAARRWAALGALTMAIAIGMGAFGAHGIRGRVSDRMLAIWETAARYQAYHALGLLALGLLRDRLDAGAKQIDRVAMLFIVGMLIFSGSLYLLVATNLRWLGAITPLGGVSWISAWILLSVTLARSKSP